MSDSIIVAIITGGITLAGNLLANRSASKKAAVEQAKRDQKIDDSINELSRRVNDHNGLSDKIADMGKAIVRIETKLESRA